MKFLVFLAFPIFLSCSTESAKRSATGTVVATAPATKPLAAKKDREVRYHCSMSSSGTYGALYIELYTASEKSAAEPVKISGMIPALECRARARSFQTVIEQIPTENFYCEVDASGSAMLFQQQLAIGSRIVAKTTKLSNSMNRHDCTVAAAAKLAAVGSTWQKI